MRASLASWPINTIGVMREDAAMNCCVPFGQQRGFGGTSMLVRPKVGREVEASLAVRRLLLSLASAITGMQIRSLQQEEGPQMRPWRMGATVFALMGVLALLVLAIGLYSVLSYLVAHA